MNLHLPTSRRSLLLALSALPLVSLAKPDPKVFVEAWKAPGCGCCEDWLKHLEANGFAVKMHEGGHEEMMRKLGLAPRYASCHIGVAGGYALEGHVPARDIRRLLKEKPQAVGLAVPGMPVGSPGMDGPEYKGRRDPFDVLLVLKSGDARVFSSYNKS
jgi:hypothetical protein